MESGAILGEQVYVAVTWKAQEDSVRQAARAEGLTRAQRRAHLVACRSKAGCTGPQSHFGTSSCNPLPQNAAGPVQAPGPGSTASAPSTD